MRRAQVLAYVMLELEWLEARDMCFGRWNELAEAIDRAWDNLDDDEQAAANAVIGAL